MSDFSQASRPLMWNISTAWLMYALFVVALGVFGFGLYRRIAFWRRGKADSERFSDWGARFYTLVKELLFQKRVRGSLFPGLFHALIFYSFAVLVFTTAIVALDYDFGTSLFRGYFYVALTVAAELAGLFILVGVGMAIYRRYVTKPATLSTTFSDVWPLLLIGLIVLTGFLVEGLRIATHGDRWALLSPVGYVFSLPFASISKEAGKTTHVVLWWSHLALAFGWIASIPYTKFVHIISLPTNVFFSKLRPRGELRRVDVLAMMEDDDLDEESFKVGVQRVEDFTWKQRLDFDACIGCGRCEEICPAVRAEHPFSPKQLISRCHDTLLSADGPGLFGSKPAKAEEGEKEREEEAEGSPEVVGNVLDEDFIWYCRTCMACTEVCPACIDHVDTVVEVRRNEALIQGRVPTEGARALKMLENLGNPFGPQSDRSDWVEKLGVRIVGPGESCDVIYWIGCCTTFDPTKQKIAQDLCKLLSRCSIDFGILGSDERCCGDPARLLGEERLFQETAKSQVEELNNRKFKLLLTSCPHCYNVLKNEYPQFGGHYDVVHHTEFLHEMLWSGEILPKLGIARRVVFHDPCYLGRYQKMYDAPRHVLRSLPGAEVLDMPSNRERSMCCGGGGGHFWMDLKVGKRINNLRVEQAREVNADTIVTACAYCKQMLEDSVKSLDLDDQIEVIDIVSLALSSLRQQPAESDESGSSSAESGEAQNA